MIYIKKFDLKKLDEVLVFLHNVLWEYARNKKIIIKSKKIAKKQRKY